MLDLNQAEPLIPFGHKALAVIIEGQYINSYEELVKIATSEEHKDKEFLDVAIIMPIIGG